VQGWEIADRRDGWIRLETRSWYLSAQAVCSCEQDRLSLSLSLRYTVPVVGHLVWGMVSGPHQRAVPVMLRQAAALMAQDDRAPA
jgi:hypothetical protein